MPLLRLVKNVYRFLLFQPCSMATLLLPPSLNYGMKCGSFETSFERISPPFERTILPFERTSMPFELISLIDWTQSKNRSASFLYFASLH